MARSVDIAGLKEELVEAVKQGDEERARALVPQLGAGPRQVRAALDAMLQDPSGLVRQAGAFGLGALGGTASARRLAQQLALEEAREDYDGESVVEEITRALGRIANGAARASLVRRLERLTHSRAGRSDVNDVALALWRVRHPELVPKVRRSLELLKVPRPNALHGLLVLLEKSPEELRLWAGDLAVPVTHKTGVLTVFVEELPDEWIPTLPAFASAASALVEPAMSPRSEAAYFCETLFSTVLLHRKRLLGALPEEACAALRSEARSLVGAASMGCALRAAAVLKYVGHPEDAAVLDAHRPADPTFAEVFDDAARTLRGPRKN
jgi:hypothetical protein